MTDPGISIEELPLSARTIVGVPTSVAAFVGWAPRGQVDTPIQVNSWAEYQRSFGALDPASPMGYAARLFFLNGGQTAQVVRAGSTNGGEATARIAISPDVVLQATSPGGWGNGITVEVDTTNVITAGNFNLTVAEGATQEAYTDVSLSGANGIKTALSASSLVTVASSSMLETVPVQETYTSASPGGVLGVEVPGDALAVLGAHAQAKRQGMYALVQADIFNMLCLASEPANTFTEAQVAEAAAFCAEQRAMLIVDPPSGWKGDMLSFQTVTGSPALGGGDPNAANAAVYYPNVRVADPVTDDIRDVGPCGAVAGVWATTDSDRGVWKAPAGTAAGISGIVDLAAHIDDDESGVLNPLAVNCLRTFPLTGPVLWGARTAAGADDLASQWKYIPVRRTALYIEESLRRGTKWAVFEPNSEPLWSSVRLSVGAFMNCLFTRGAFAGATTADAYVLQCDARNNPPSTVDQGVLNILVGFAPLTPAEFVIIEIQQLAGQQS